MRKAVTRYSQLSQLRQLSQIPTTNITGTASCSVVVAPPFKGGSILQLELRDKTNCKRKEWV